MVENIDFYRTNNYDVITTQFILSSLNLFVIILFSKKFMIMSGTIFFYVYSKLLLFT